MLGAVTAVLSTSQQAASVTPERDSAPIELVIVRGTLRDIGHVRLPLEYRWAIRSIPTGIHVVATTTLVSIRRANCVCCSSCRPREVSRGAKPCRMDTKTDLRFCEGRRRAIKCFVHAHSVSGSTQHCFAPLEPSRGRQEELHTQFARRMETKVVVATTTYALV